MKKIIVFFASLVVALVGCTTAYCQEYGNAFPSYVKYSGGCYIEVNSTLGKGSIVFPYQYKNNTFGFSGSSGYNVINCTNSSITVKYIASNGTEYSARFSAWAGLEVKLNTSANQYTTVTISQILNTNVDFMDNTENDRQSDAVFTKYDFSFKEQFYIGFAVVAMFLILATKFLYYMRNRGY